MLDIRVDVLNRRDKVQGAQIGILFPDYSDPVSRRWRIEAASHWG